MARKREELQALGRESVYSQKYAPQVLEAFENQHFDQTLLRV